MKSIALFASLSTLAFPAAYPQDSSLFPATASLALGFNTLGDRDLGKVLRRSPSNDGRRYELYYGFRGRHHTASVEIRAHAYQVDERDLYADNGNPDRRAYQTTQSGSGVRSAPSRFPAGLDSYWMHSTGTTNHYALDGPLEFAMVDVTRFDSSDATTDAVISSSTALIELGARTLLARVVARRLEATVHRNIGGQDVRAYQCKFSQREFLDLHEWAAARGWSVGTPDKVPCVTLTKEGREILLPLAAMQGKVDGQWRDLGDCVAEKEGRWLVPATLDGLTR